MEKSEVISTLNDLLKTTKDGQDGFRTCAEQVKGANLKSVFRQQPRGATRERPN